MSRASWQALVAASVLALAGSACSRSSTDGAGPSAALTAPAAPSAAPALTPEVPSAAPSGGPRLTPEDAEDDAAHRITEQNLESELDRLEREIQAE